MLPVLFPALVVSFWLLLIHPGLLVTVNASKNQNYWGAWDINCRHKAMNITPLITWEKRHQNRKCSKIFLQTMRKGQHQSDQHRNCWSGTVGNTGKTSERWGGVHMGFPEHVDTIWTELNRTKEMRRRKTGIHDNIGKTAKGKESINWHSEGLLSSCQNPVQTKRNYPAELWNGPSMRLKLWALWWVAWEHCIWSWHGRHMRKMAKLLAKLQALSYHLNDAFCTDMLMEIWATDSVLIR